MGFFNIEKEFDELTESASNLLDDVRDFEAKNFGSDMPSYIHAVRSQVESGEYDIWIGTKNNTERRFFDFETFLYSGTKKVLAWFKNIRDLEMYAGLFLVANELGKEVQVYLSDETLETENEHVKRLLEERIVRVCNCDCDCFVILFDEKHSICSAKNEEGNERIIISANRHMGERKEVREAMVTYMSFFSYLRKHAL